MHAVDEEVMSVGHIADVLHIQPELIFKSLFLERHYNEI
jgi:hypothetical protein